MNPNQLISRLYIYFGSFTNILQAQQQLKKFLTLPICLKTGKLNYIP